MKSTRNVPSFGAYSLKLIAELETDGRWGTARTYTKTRSSFLHFLQKDSGSNDIPINRIDDRLISRYNLYLRGRAVVRNTMSFYNRVLRAIYNKAVCKFKFPDLRPFQNVYTGIDKTTSRAIDEGCIARLSTINTGSDAELTIARDLFLFSYYTRGMSFVDMAYLRRTQIYGNVLTYTRRKTGKTLRILLEPEVKAILKKYTGVRSDSPYIFPLLAPVHHSDSKRNVYPFDSIETYRTYGSRLSQYNRKLRKLAEMAGIRNRFTSHVARHSWANAARNIGHCTEIISEALGHSSERTTRIYLASIGNSTIDHLNRRLLSRLKKYLPVSTVETGNKSGKASLMATDRPGSIISDSCLQTIVLET
ncbi:MAG: site-specific integrase [Bacteroidales bacterium]|nr:site-specific integrase [Candidatus Egerieousia equi]